MAQFGRALRSGRRGRKFESCHLDQKRTEALASVLFCLWVLKINLVVAAQQVQVRIPHQTNDKLACRAQGVGITESRGVTLSPRPNRL